MSAPGADPFDVVLGQDRAVGVLRAAVRADRLASAYLFDGASGVGKELLATSLAKAVLCAGLPAPAAAEVARRIDAGAHPDVRVVRPRDEGQRNLQVQSVRDEILPFTQYAPFEGRAAFLVFPEADVSFPEAHPEAANALLKTIEEPRARVHFVLLSARPERLLVTIRSRTQRLALGRLSESVLDQILRARGIEDRKAAIALADGRADRAIELSEEGRARALFELAMTFDDAVASGSPGRIATISEELGRTAPFERTLEALATFYRDVAAAALEVPAPLLRFGAEQASLRERAGRLGVGRASAACALLRELEDEVAENASKELALARLAAALA